MGTWNIQTIGMKMMVEGKPVAKDDGQSERRSNIPLRTNKRKDSNRVDPNSSLC